MVGIIIMCYQSLNIYAEQNDSKAYKIRTIVIDAGHGGKDNGCHGGNSTLEKTVTLKVALKLGAFIKENYPDIKVYYTRMTDKFIELHERADIANRNNADLFISIHCNANPSKTPYGTETYVLGLHKSADNLDVAKRENEVITLENNYKSNYDGFDPNDPTTHIILSLNQHAHLEQSTLFAQKIQTQYKQTLKRNDRGVKQAGFAVLYRTTMPSVLTEIGFLTNNTEEAYLSSSKGQDFIASAIYRAFKDYKNILEKNTTGTSPEKKNYPDTAGIGEDLILEMGLSELPLEGQESNVPKESIEEPKQKDTVIIPLIEQTTLPTEIVSPVIETESDVFFRIQVAATKTKIPTTNTSIYKLKELQIEFLQEKEIFRYLTGKYSSLELAKKDLQILKKGAFKDAFIVVYKKNSRLLPLDAEKYLGQ